MYLLYRYLCIYSTDPVDSLLDNTAHAAVLL